MALELIVGVDVGGTKVLAGVVDEGRRVTATARRDTPPRSTSARALEDVVVDTVREAAGGAVLRGVGVAAAGFVDTAGERVMFAPHLAWRGEAVRQRLQERLGCQVALDNDASCAALAESTDGAGRGAASMVMITLGTGIGGGIVWAGTLLRGANGMAGEFGHMQVVPDGHPCECGRRGCWEQYCSGNELLRFARGRIGREPTVLEDLCGGRPEELTGPMVSEAAAQGDLTAREALNRVGGWLGVGVANIVAALDPEIVVIGGGVSTAGDRLLEPARDALARSLVGSADRTLPPLVAAELGPQAGLLGAAGLVRQRLAQLRR